MKLSYQKTLTGLILISLLSCYVEKPLKKSSPKNNETYRVEYLFEHEGCKVYRFHDKGNYIYYTNCNADVTSIVNDSTIIRVTPLKK